MSRVCRALTTVLWATALLVAVPLHAFAAQGEAKTSGESCDYIHALAMDAEGRSLFLGTHFGLFRSQDGGRSWKRVWLSQKYPHVDVLTITPHLRDRLTIYVGTHEAGVLKSTDGGTSWKQANRGLGALDIHGLAVDATDPRKLYAATRGKGRGIYRSTDGGESWTRVGHGLRGEVNALAWVALPTGTAGGYLYAGTTAGLEWAAESVGGWERVGGLPAHPTVSGVAAAVGETNAMYILTHDGLFRSRDAGKSWESIGPGPERLTAVAMNPKRPVELYTISCDGVIFTSTDGGMTWDVLRE